ncbi:MAG: cytidine deaminase [Atopostipes suicloacalis]|nr:cytidine deaminase [Atopostipes suicloacalis]
MTKNSKELLIKEANDMLKNAYVPYSNFPVGAAIISKSGEVFTGCNVENSSYGLSMCAERNAIFKAVTEGTREFDKLVVTGNTEGPIAPCGACRQVMSEFCSSDMPVVLTNVKGDTRETTVGELLPGAFTPEDLKD